MISSSQLRTSLTGTTLLIGERTAGKIKCCRIANGYYTSWMHPCDD